MTIETTTKLTASERKLRALDLFLADTPFTKIAKETGFKLMQVKKWAKDERWFERKVEFERAAMAEFGREYRKLIAKARLEVIRRHLEICQDLDQAIHEKFRKDEETDTRPFKTEMQLLDIARALKSSADVAARAAGVNDGATTEAMNPGKRPVVIVNVQPQPVGSSDSVDAEFEEADVPF